MINFELLTYEQYKGFGGKVYDTDMSFRVAYAQAYTYVRKNTFNRIDKIELTETLKEYLGIMMYELIDALTYGNIKSESNEGMSVSYKNGTSPYTIVSRYLSYIETDDKIPLIYAGATVPKIPPTPEEPEEPEEPETPETPEPEPEPPTRGGIKFENYKL